MSSARTQQMKVLRPLVMSRANGQCEAGQRCPYPAAELHHVLPRAHARRRDEHILDAWATDEVKRGEHPDLPWLAALCKRCHDLAHQNRKWAEALGLLVKGEVRTAVDGTPEYRGPEPALAELFPVRSVA